MKYRTGIIYSASQKSLCIKTETLSNSLSSSGVYKAKSKSFFEGWRKRLGFLFISASLAGLSFFFSPYIAGKIAQNKRKGFASLIVQEIQPTEITEIKTSNKSDKPDEPFDSAQGKPNKSSESEDKPVINSFYLTIEKIGLHSAPVIPEIDANNTDLYEEALRYGLVHAQNSALPDESGMIYIFGHSANYPWVLPRTNALFFEINKVEPGDKVKIELNGKHFLYHVFDKKIVNPNELDLIKANIDQDVLVLQSCYPAGTTLKRLLLFAKPSKMGALIY